MIRYFGYRDFLINLAETTVIFCPPSSLQFIFTFRFVAHFELKCGDTGNPDDGRTRGRERPARVQIPAEQGINRADWKSQVRQCLGFSTAVFWSSLA